MSNSKFVIVTKSLLESTRWVVLTTVGTIWNLDEIERNAINGELYRVLWSFGDWCFWYGVDPEFPLLVEVVPDADYPFHTPHHYFVNGIPLILDEDDEVTFSDDGPDIEAFLPTDPLPFISPILSPCASYPEEDWEDPKSGCGVRFERWSETESALDMIYGNNDFDVKQDLEEWVLPFLFREPLPFTWDNLQSIIFGPYLADLILPSSTLNLTVTPLSQ